MCEVVMNERTTTQRGRVVNYLSLPPKTKPMKEMKLPVGTRIKFTKELSSGPDEFSPGNLYAPKGGLGEVVGHDCWEGHRVKWDKWKHPFGAVHGEEFVEDHEYKLRYGGE